MTDSSEEDLEKGTKNSFSKESVSLPSDEDNNSFVFGNPEKKSTTNDEEKNNDTVELQEGKRKKMERIRSTHWRKDIVPIQLVWNNLSYSVQMKKNDKKKKSSRSDSVSKFEEDGDAKKSKKGDSKEQRYLLKNVSGVVNPGTLLAIMGSSGAGKTTLLNVLAGRVQGKVEGEILLNGHKREESLEYLHKQAYVMQDDILMASQTPREILTFSAFLRMPKTYTKEEKLTRVNELIDELNIGACQNTRVGAAGFKRGISGGERKRVAVASELLTNPSLLFLDEPTSGLDSFTAENLMESLRNLAQAGRTIVCTIHQPNSQIFQQFDQLMLLAKGEVVYYGAASKAVDYFSSVGHPVPPLTNPSDFFLKLIHIDHSMDEGDERVLQLIEAYKKKPQTKPKIAEIPLSTEKNTSFYETNVFVQWYLLILRNFSDVFRNPLKIRAQLGQTIFLALLVGLIYLQIDTSQTSSQDRLGALFFILVNQAMGSVSNLVSLFPEERSVFFRENSNRMYRTTSYYLAKTLGDLPFQIGLPFLFATITYWMIGFQQSAEKYFLYLITIVVVANVGAALGLLLGIAAKDSSTAFALVPVTLIPFMIFSGFFVNNDTVPPYFIWVEYISFIKYAFEAIVINEFEGLKFTCEGSEQLPNGMCRINDGEAVIKSLGMQGEHHTVWENILILIGMVIFCRLVGYLALLWRARRQTANA